MSKAFRIAELALNIIDQANVGFRNLPAVFACRYLFSAFNDTGPNSSSGVLNRVKH